MGFFDKLKSDFKFKKAGKGQKLTSTSSTSSSNSQPSQPPKPVQKPPSQPQPNNQAQNAARNAALARFAGQPQNQTSTTKSQRSILARAKEELRNEQATVKPFNQEDFDREISQKLALDPTALPKKEVCTTDANKAHGVYFICPFTDKRVKRHEIESHLEELLDQFIATQQSQITAAANDDNAIDCPDDSSDRKILLNIIFTLNDCNIEKWNVCMATLSTYFNNIINNPTDEKYRKIKKLNKAFQNRVASLAQMHKMMAVLGFELIEIDGVEYYIYQSTASANSSPSTSSSSPSKDTDKLSSWIYSFSETPERVNFKLDNNPILFFKNPNSRSNTNSQSSSSASSSASSHPQLSADFYNISKTDLKQMYNNRKTESELNSILMTSEMRQKLLAKQTKKYKYCLLRIKFPDELILQGIFRPSDRGSSVLNFVREHLILPDLPFELQVPGSAVLTEECNLEKHTPSSLMNFKIGRELLNDVREQTGSLHLVKRELLAEIKEL